MEVAVNSLVGVVVLLLLPPLVAVALWQAFGMGGRNGNLVTLQSVRLGRYGFWIILGVAYTVTFAVAFVEHKF